MAKITEKPVKALFGVAGAGAFPIITGMICGYPAGAAMSAELYRDGKLSSAIENFLLNYIGVPQSQIDSFKSIMLQ